MRFTKCIILAAVCTAMFGSSCESLLLDLVSGSWHLGTRAGNVAACCGNRRLCVISYLSVRTY